MRGEGKVNGIDSIKKRASLDSEMEWAVKKLARRLSRPDVAEMALMHVIRPGAASEGGYENLVQAELYRILVGDLLGAGVSANIEYNILLNGGAKNRKRLDIVLIDRKSGNMASIELSHNNMRQLNNKHKPCGEEKALSDAKIPLLHRYYIHTWTCFNYFDFSASDGTPVRWMARDIDTAKRPKSMAMDPGHVLVGGDSCEFCGGKCRISRVGDGFWEGNRNEFSVDAGRKKYNIEIQSGFALYKNSQRSR